MITLMLVERDLLPSPLLYLSADFEATRQEYYARLLAVTERGEWAEWLPYFLRGVALQAEDALERIRRIDELLAGWRLHERDPDVPVLFFTSSSAVRTSGERVVSAGAAGIAASSAELFELVGRQIPIAVRNGE